MTVEGVGWDVAYDRAQSTPMMWGWGAHTPWNFTTFTTRPRRGVRPVFPLPQRDGGRLHGCGPGEHDLEESYELWKKAQWDGETGVTQDGDIPWIWLVNIDHLYWSRTGLEIAEQKLHPHGHAGAL